MRERRVLLCLVLAAAQLAVIAPALAAAGKDLPFRFNPALDGKIAYASDPVSGAVCAAWSYRSRGEFDLAVSVRDLTGKWSEPELFGKLDGRDQISPALVADAVGNVYLAFSVRETSQIFLSVLPQGSRTWLEPFQVTNGRDRCFSPALAVVADRLVLGYRTFDGRVSMLDLPLFVPDVARPLGIYDNPDGTDPLGMSGQDDGTPPPNPNGGFKPVGGGAAQK